MSANLCLEGKSFEVVGDGMAPDSAPCEWARDPRFPAPYGGFGFVTLQGDAIPDGSVRDVHDCLTAMYAGQANPEEETMTAYQQAQLSLLTQRYDAAGTPTMKLIIVGETLSQFGDRVLAGQQDIGWPVPLLQAVARCLNHA